MLKKGRLRCNEREFKFAVQQRPSVLVQFDLGSFSLRVFASTLRTLRLVFFLLTAEDAKDAQRCAKQIEPVPNTVVKEQNEGHPEPQLIASIKGFPQRVLHWCVCYNPRSIVSPLIAQRFQR
jgi:hypothetical protein